MTLYGYHQIFEPEDFEFLFGLEKDIEAFASLSGCDAAMEREAEVSQDPMALVLFAWSQLNANDEDFLKFGTPVDCITLDVFSPAGSDVELTALVYNEDGDELKVSIHETGWHSTFVEQAF